MGAPGRKMALSTLKIWFRGVCSQLKLHFYLTERIIIDDKEERTKPKKYLNK